MSDRTKIACADATWNPVTGCTKLSAGCDNCYAARFAERFRGVAEHPYEMGFALTLRPERLGQPLHWRRPKLIFVNSMSDLFHKSVPRTYVDRVFDVMEQANWHVFQVLTKRSALMRSYIERRYAGRAAPIHIWLGVSVETRAAMSRLQQLTKTRATTRFVCFEPLLGPIGALDLSRINWVIASGETGPRARPAKPDWFREIRDQCEAARVPFFFKQWGGYTAKTKGNVLDGRQWLDIPIERSVSHPEVSGEFAMSYRDRQQ